MILKPIDIKQYAESAEKFIGVFGTEEWLSIYGESIKIIGIFKDERQLIGGFYFLRTKKYGVNFLKLPPYTPHCGLFFVSESTNRSSGNSFSKEVITEVCNYLMRENAALLVLAFPSSIIDLQPFIWSKFKVIPNYTYRIDLGLPIEAIKSNFDPKNRNVINKALKEGVIVEENMLESTELNLFFLDSLRAAGANIYKEELKGIFQKFSNDKNSFSVTAKKGNEVLGTVFCVMDGRNCYYLLGGLSKNNKLGGVNNLLVLRSIEIAKERGCKTFDFEGSMLKGVEKFFRSFGPELVPYYTVNKAKLPIEMLLKFKKRELF